MSATFVNSAMGMLITKYINTPSSSLKYCSSRGFTPFRILIESWDLRFIEK